MAALLALDRHVANARAVGAATVIAFWS